MPDQKTIEPAGPVPDDGRERTTEAGKGASMKRSLATSCFVIAALLLPMAPAPAAAAAAAPTPAPSAVKDSAMAAQIRDRLKEEKTVDLASVKVAADHDGTVVLSGKVETRAAEEKAVSIARATEGVKIVTSRIQIINAD